MRKIFQDDDKELFCDMWHRGKSVEDIAAYFGLKPNTVRKYAKCKFNLPLRRRKCRHSILSDPKKVQFLQRNYADMGAGVIAVFIGSSPDCVRRAARRLGLKHSEQYRADDYAYRSKKTSETRKAKFAQGLYPQQPKDADTGQFVGKAQ